MEKPKRFVGLRVKQAREAADLTQDALAEKLGFNDRQTVSDIENGKRNLRPEELVAVAQATDRDVDYFVNPYAVVGEATFAWRVDPRISDDALNRFEATAGQWVGLFRWLRDQYGTPPSVLQESLRPPRTFEEADERAEELCREWNLGEFPAEKLLETVEDRLRVPVIFVDPLREGDKTVSGATCRLNDLSVILINRKEIDSRRNFDLAHELFHVLTWDALTPDRRETTNARGPQRIERLADHFAAALLMPRVSLEKRLDIIRSGDTAKLCELAAAFRVSPSALSYRLLNLGLVSKEKQERLERCRSAERSEPKPFSLAFMRMLHEAIYRGRISGRKAAKLVGLEFDELQNLFKQYDLGSPLAA